MINIISFKICPFVQRVSALLEAKNLPYEVQFISLSDKPEWFLKLSPNAQMPVLLTESGQALFESDAIVEYIDEISDPLETNLSPEQRANNRAWSYQASKQYLAQCSAQRSPDATTLAERATKFGKALDKAERALGDGPFFNGEQLGNVDLAWLVLLHRTDIIRRHTGYDFVAQLPKVRAWREALLATGLAERSVAPDFEQAFTDFYLSPNTVLGGSQAANDSADNACRTGTCC